MALQNCPDCSNSVSDKAASCPNCGYVFIDESTDDAENLVKFYELTVAEEHYHSTTFNGRIEFYLKLISTLFAALLVGQRYATDWYFALCLSILAGLLVWICYNAQSAVKSGYRRFLEAVTVRSMLEFRLNMTKPLSDASDNNDIWVEKEPLVNKRHLDSRTWDKKNQKVISSSEDFVNTYINRGMVANSRKFFFATAGFAVILSLILLIKAVTLCQDLPPPKLSHNEATITVPLDKNTKALNSESEQPDKVSSEPEQDTTNDKP